MFQVSQMNELLLNALQGVSSVEEPRRKQAEASLKQWETQPGFHVALLVYFDGDFQRIFTNRIHPLKNIYCSMQTATSIDAKTRFFAISYFKNGMDRFWRKTAKK